MRSVLIIVSLLITYGSLYPFDLHWPAQERLDAIFAPSFEPFATTRGDILGNIGLFVPFGLVGMLAARNVPTRGARWVVVLLMAGGLAFALQALQLFLPSRDPRLLDVFWNVAGTIAGALLAAVPMVGRLMPRGAARVRPDVPVLLVSAWIASQLVPFVPSLDLQLVKDSLKPLLLAPRLAPGDASMIFAAWFAALALLGSSRPAWAASPVLGLLPIAVLAPQPFILGNDLTLAEVLGAAAAAVAWYAARPAPGPVVPAVLLAAGIVASQTQGIDFAAPAGAFSWVPFAGSLEGGMLANVVALSRKVFLYGALLWWLRACGLGWRTATVSAVAALAVLEGLQVKVPGATPEITDPVLVALLGLGLRAAGSVPAGRPGSRAAERQSGRRASPDSVGEHPTGALAESGRLDAGWVSVPVELTAEQAACLEVLARRTGRSVSGAVRLLVADFIARLDAPGGGSMPQVRDADVAPDGRLGAAQPRTEIVHLRAEQAAILDRIAAGFGLAVARTVQSIVDEFVRSQPAWVAPGDAGEGPPEPHGRAS